MKTQFLTCATAALLLAGAAAPTAEACTTSSRSLTSSQFRRAAVKKRTPLKDFLGKPPAKADATATTEPSITGLWTTAFVDGDMVEDAGFEQFSMGGTHVLNDPSPILEGNVCLGAWTQVAPFTYLINHPSYVYDDPGVNVTGIATIYEKIVLDPSGDSFNETYRVVVTDLDGNVLLTLDGTAIGKRVKGENNPLQ